jgi:hypothetical protein
VLALLPIKLLAFYLFGKGQVVVGPGAVVDQKLAGTALTARLFQLTQPSLMQLRWFARRCIRWKIWKDRVLLAVSNVWPWRMARQLKSQSNLFLKRWCTRIQSALKSAGL